MFLKVNHYVKLEMGVFHVWNRNPEKLHEN